MGWFKKRKKEIVVDEIDLKKSKAKPYFYLTMSAYGGPSQDVSEIKDASVPADVLERARKDGGLMSLSTFTEPPSPATYQEGVMCTFWASSRLEAAGTLMAFATLSDDMLESSLMHNVAMLVGELDLADDERSEEDATQVYEFTKSEDQLVVPFPTVGTDGEFDYSECFMTVDSPRRTDSEAASLVVRGSGVIWVTNALPALMSALHKDISGVYGTTVGDSPAPDLGEGTDDDEDWYQ